MEVNELVRNGADALTVWRSVEKLAQKIANRFPVGDREDLMQEFFIVTDKARKSWNGTTPFANYAARLMEYRAMTYYRDNSQASAAGHGMARKYSKLRDKYGEDRQAIRKAAGWNKQQLETAEKAFNIESIVSTQTPTKEAPEFTLEDTFIDPTAEEAFQDAEREEDRAALKRVVNESLLTLKERNRRIMMDYYGLMGAECLGITQTARKHNLTTQAVSLISKNARRKMMAGKNARALTAYFNHYLAGHNFYNGTGVTAFLCSGASSVESAVLRMEELREQQAI